MSKFDTACSFCHVLPAYGHFDWCKIDRAPTSDEIVHAVLEEEARSMGDNGPSAALTEMCVAYLAAKTT